MTSRIHRRDVLAYASAAALIGSGARAQPMPVVSSTVPQGMGAGPLPSLGTALPPGVSLDLSFMTPGTMPSGVTFTRASTATYFDSTGTLQTAAANAPRWDYDPVTHALRGLLIEEARSNVLLNSATLATQSVAVTAQAYTLSFYGTGTVTLSGASTGSLVGTGAFPQRASRTFTPTAGSLTCTVTGSVLNANLEAGPFATSFVATTAAAVTRAQDSCLIPPASMGFFVSPGGSWMAEFIDFNPPSASVTPRVISYPSAGNIAPLGGSTTLQCQQYDGAGGGFSANTFSPNAVVKAATTWAVGAAQNCLNAGAVASSASLTAGYAPLASGGVRLMADETPGDGMSGYLRHVRYWPRALTAAELQQVTT